MPESVSDAVDADTPEAEPTKEKPEGAVSHEMVCTVGFCPICMAVSAVQPLKPEIIEHLALAARELMLVARAVLDSRAAQVGGEQEETPEPRLEKIDIG
jgi:hypothetical protein